MAERFLCALAGYDRETEAHLAGLQNELYAHGFSGTQTRNLPQHITLGSFPTDQEAALSERLRRIARETRPFEVTFNHLGLFSGGRVLFVAPDPNRPLLALRERFDSSDNWTPHTTMLIDEPEPVLRALPVLTERFAPFRGRVERLYLYEFWPTRFILSLPLNEKEVHP
ncbi:MAG: 2'-5' RNA ligase family protein [Clostridia bacterium]|nr:2'-5' RNA ligase family protein [Clostridia bacterium]